MEDCRVVLVDDHVLFRDAISRGLTASGQGIRIVAEAGSSSEVLQILTVTPADVVVLDLSLPGRGGADVLAQISKRFPDVRVLILSAHPADSYIAQLLSQGARGYCHKSCSLEALLAAIRTVNDGDTVIGDDVRALIERAAGGDEPPHNGLSSRERQVMENIVAGASLSEIGRDMNLSVKTTSTYRRRLLDKLGLSSNSELVRYAMRHGMFNDPYTAPAPDASNSGIDTVLHRLSSDVTALRLHAELLQTALNDDAYIASETLRGRVEKMNAVASQMQDELTSISRQQGSR